MYGAILGDIIGSPFEFDRGTKTKDFELFTKGCQFTDDSVMTAAIAEALIAVGPDATKEEIETGRKKFGAMLGDFVEVGCNSVLNPGTVIGRHTNIYPLSRVRGVIPADSIFKDKDNVVLKK